MKQAIYEAIFRICKELSKEDFADILEWLESDLARRDE